MPNEKINVLIDVTKIHSTLPMVNMIAPNKPTDRIEIEWNKIFANKPAQLIAPNDVPITAATALVSALMLFRNSPYIIPNEIIMP